MSSKRKNTPTKLPKDDVVSERPIYNSIPRDFHGFDLNGDIRYKPTLHIIENHETTINGIDHQDLDSSFEKDRPTNKKQRILQSIKNSSSDSESDQEYNSTNNNSTKPSLGLQRKSMDSVLERLNSNPMTSTESLMGKEYFDNCLNMASHGAQDKQLLVNIQQLLSDTDAQEDKEKKLGEMIAQLQTLRENIKKEKQVNDLTLYQKTKF